ncbi:NCS1 nucleoside transporter family [Meredithblackwellia eburnea MCA 4105]
MNVLRKIDDKIKVKQPSSRWSNEDLDPVPPEKQNWNMMDMAYYWLSDASGPNTWTVGSSLIALGWTGREAIPYTFIGNLLIASVSYTNSRIGIKTHCSFPIILRSSFGLWATFIPVMARALAGLIWFLYLSFSAADLTSVLISAIWPSYNHIRNRFPDSAGITTQQLISLVLFWLVQTPISLVPIRKLNYFLGFKAYMCPVLFTSLMIWGLVVTHGGHTPYITGKSNPQLGGGAALAALTAINSVVSGGSTISTNIPDFSRYAKSTRHGWVQLLVLPIGNSYPIICGIITTSAAQSYYGVEGAWAPADLIALFGNRAVRFFVSLGFLIATIGVNISANSVSFANDFSSLVPRYFNLFRASALAMILVFAGTPWLLIRNGGAFISFLSAYGILLSGLSSIMTVDFYWLRKQKVDVREFYKIHGRYWYSNGCNWRAVAAWVISFAPNLPGMIHGINPAIPNKNVYTYCVSWLWGTIWAGGLYAIFSTIWPPYDSFVDEAVWTLDPPEVLEQNNLEGEKSVDEDSKA